MPVLMLIIWVSVIIIFKLLQRIGLLSDNIEYVRHAQFEHGAAVFKQGYLRIKEIQKEYEDVYNSLDMKDNYTKKLKAHDLVLEAHPELKTVSVHNSDPCTDLADKVAMYCTKSFIEQRKKDKVIGWHYIGFEFYHFFFGAKETYRKLKKFDESRNAELIEDCNTYLWKGVTDEQKKAAESYEIDWTTGKYIDDWEPD